MSVILLDFNSLSGHFWDIWQNVAVAKFFGFFLDLTRIES